MNKAEAPYTEEELDSITFAVVDAPGGLKGLGSIKLADLKNATHSPMTPLCLGLPPKLWHIVESAPFMFQTFKDVMKETEGVINALELVNHRIKTQFNETSPLSEEILRRMSIIQDICLMARRVAVVGSDELSKEIDAEGVDRRKRKS